MPKSVVLVVEDDAVLRSDAVTMLEEAGAEVVGAESADDALSYLVEHAGDVAAVFTDVRTPGCLDGLQLARSITSTWPGILVLVTSGEIRSPSELPSQVQFMPKPWRRHDVLTALAA